MISSQQQADQALAQWQSLRELAPEIRIERIMADFFLPPIDLDIRYEDELLAVSEAMELV